MTKDFDKDLVVFLAVTEEESKEENLKIREIEKAGTTEEKNNGDDDNDLQVKLDANISLIPGLHVSEEERRQTIDKKKKAGNDKNEKGQVQVSCDFCRKVLNKKPQARHMRDLHPNSRPSVSSFVNDFDKRRKAGANLTPPASEPAPKKVELEGRVGQMMADLH